MVWIFGKISNTAPSHSERCFCRVTEIRTSYIDPCAVSRISAYLVDYDSVVKAVDYF